MKLIVIYLEKVDISRGEGLGIEVLSI